MGDGGSVVVGEEYGGESLCYLDGSAESFSRGVDWLLAEFLADKDLEDVRMILNRVWERGENLEK